MALKVVVVQFDAVLAFQDLYSYRHACRVWCVCIQRLMQWQ